ncbi:RNA polymerase sigma factor [Armatimonas rosea]|uniref:RNA polymerase sigma factor (Sigma-70 family) n=1 Tax=Armatimonas rosea TaxID=685828 RepID=A0A7W9SKQ5_ARMRO|nr:sigma-70 family RNA polymerase sigma factor [Armatimonas rosea]MBB6048427.1 RNA polymerase sigma factor (sigma-70 family) [Armatimonas rosea]
MRTLTDQELLRRYVRQRSAEAFGELGRRYANLVFSACLRETHDRTLAEDAAQAVFLLLSQKAHTLRDPKKLPSWLFSVAVLTSKNLMKAERRRAGYEEAFAKEAAVVTPAVDVGEVLPELNTALTQLRPAEQTAILLRFMEQKSLTEVGEALGVSENTARMRVNRALQKLQQRLGKLGVTVSVAALSLALERESAAHTAPETLVAFTAQIGAEGMIAGTGKAVLLTQRIDHQLQVASQRHRGRALTAGLLLVGVCALGGHLVTQSPTDSRLQLALAAQGNAVFAPLAGTWDGTLEYTRNGSRERSRIPVRAAISVGANVLQWQNKTREDLPIAQPGQTLYLDYGGGVSLTNGGLAQPAQEVSQLVEFTKKSSGTFILLVTHPTQEMRYTFTLQGNTLECLWERRNPDRSFERMNYWTLTRKK